uniref:Ribonuclease T(2) n=1 Tax=Elaeophora elaphi TaxID=1147741 RepID=A0A0R3RYD0_9BILA
MDIIALLSLTTALTQMNIEKGDFDYFKLALIYPTSVCHAYDGPTKFIAKEMINDFCKVPVDAAPWTIHGLWPNRYDGSFPQFCGDKEKFNLTKLLPIRQKLEKEWPNLFTVQPVLSFWKHEWEKHGTCAKVVKEVNDEVKYFNKSLVLCEQYNIYKMLEKQGIIPSKEKLYDGMSLHRNLTSAYGKNVEFHCLQDKETKNWLLADVRLCLTKNFQPMDCKKRRWKWQSSKKSLSSAYQPCPADGIVYPPFRNTRAVNCNSIAVGNVILILFLMLCSLWNPFILRYQPFQFAHRKVHFAKRVR